MYVDDSRTFSKEELKDIHQKAVLRFQESVMSEASQRENYLDDIKFVNGDQWPEEILAARGDRPHLVINEARKYADNVVNGARTNPPSMRAIPVGYGSSTELAETRNVILAHIQQVSGAPEVFLTALDNAVCGGYGYFRIRSKYLDDEAMEQDLVLEKIPDSLSVVYDQNAKQLDYSDSRWCWIVNDMPEEVFKAEWPEASTIDWERPNTLGTKSMFFNFSEKKVKVAEYYFRWPVKKTITMFSDGSVYDTNTDYFKDNIKIHLEVQGIKPAKTRVIDSYDIYWCIMNGVEILEPPKKEPTPDIPVIPVIGREKWINGKRVLSSLVRDSKDPARMLNYWVSNATEQVALQSEAPYITTAEAIAGYEDEWLEDGPQKFKRYNTGEEKPTRDMPAQLSSGLAAMIEMSKAQIPDVIGITPDKLGQPTNARSQSAIAERTQNSDVGPYVFIDHLLKAVSRAGDVLNRRIPIFYDTHRILTIMGQDGKPKTAEINSYDPASGQISNNTSEGRFRIMVEAGPALSTLRKQSADNMMQALQWAPQFADVIIPLIAHAASWPGARELETAIQQKIAALQAPKPPSLVEKGQAARLQGTALANTKQMMDLQSSGVDVSGLSGNTQNQGQPASPQ